MSSHGIIHRSLVAAFVLSIAGVAFARQPPALTQAQRTAKHAAMCEGRKVQAGAGYRDGLVRFGLPVQARQARVAKAAGYRDALKRFGTGAGASEVACRHLERTPRTSASR